MRGRHFVIFYVVATLLVLVPGAQAACIKRHGVQIASGTSPSGWPWSVEGTIGPNGPGCRDWLFGMEFELQGATNWGWGTGIPAGGHLGRGFQIDAFDELLEDGSDRVVSGTVNGEVAKIQFALSNNRRIWVKPKAPAERLRRKVIWLRNVQYFVDYYPPEGFVTGVATFSTTGQLLYRDKNFEQPM